MNGAASLQSAVRFLASQRPEARRFAARAWLGAPLVRATLSAAGLRRTLRLIEGIPAPRSPRRAAIGAEEGAALVAGAFRHHFVGGACLPQAVLQLALHRRDGVPARLVVGVSRPDDGRALDAHAWIEADSPGEGTHQPSSFAPIFVHRAGAPRS